MTGRGPLDLAADRLDVMSWPPHVLDAVRVIVDQAQHAVGCRMCSSVDVALAEEVSAVFDRTGYGLGFVDLADAVCELGAELRAADRRCLDAHVE